MNTRSARTRRASWLAAVCVALLVSALALPSAALAVVTREGNRVVIEEGDVLRDDLFAAGTTLLIQGDVEGDVYLAGREIVIQGDVSGNVVAAGQTVRVTGAVGGTVLAACGDLVIEGSVGKDVVSSSGTLRLDRSARVTRDMLSAAGTLSLDGNVGRNATIAGGQVDVDGRVDGYVRAEAQDLRLGSNADIGGDVVYRTTDSAQFEDGSTIGGERRRLAPRPTRRTDPASAALFAILAWIRSLIGLAVFTLLVGLLFPIFLGRAAWTARVSPGASAGIGFVAMVAIPVAALIAFAFGILAGGWWIGLMILALYAIALVTAYVVTATLIGTWLLERLMHRRPHIVLGALLGILLLAILMAIPIIGWLLGFVAQIIGLGALVITATRRESVAY